MTSVFNLPTRLSAKADPSLIADDEAHFALVAASTEAQVAQLEARLDEFRRMPGGTGQAALERDLEVHRLGARLRTLRRYGLDLCLGRFVTQEGEVVHIGRIGLGDGADRRLLVDWRSPAAEPFFAATHADPRGLVSRRRYRWTDGRITDYWDEVYDASGATNSAALDDQSAFIASLGASRSPRMRDVLGTIQADQDAIIRASSRGALVVDGGPGTGKTVVALHRTAYLIHADRRLGEHSGGVLFVGPHQPYLSYVEDVLPSLGEEGVRTCTLRDLVPGGEGFPEESDAEVARLKADARMVAAIEPAVALYEEVPTDGMVVATAWGEVWLSPDDWAEAITSIEPGSTHNDARDQVWDALLAILVDKIAADGAHEHPDLDDTDSGDEFDAYGLDAGDDEEPVRRSLETNVDLVEAIGRVWPRLDPSDVVGDLWEVPAYLRRCAPWLSPEEVAALQRGDVKAWTLADLPLLDAARRRVGDPEASRRRRSRQAAVRAERRERAEIAEQLIASDDSEMKVMSMLRGQDLRHSLEETPTEVGEEDRYFAHVVVDEAQELTDAEWQMLLSRCPSRSMTIVGDRAQARHGFTESWTERLERVGLGRIDVATLGINYRTPEEVMTEAAPLILAAIPDANVPTSVRRTGLPVTHGSVDDLDAILAEWLATHDDGVACVISTGLDHEETHHRVRRLRPEHAKGLEFDLVVLIEPDAYGTGIGGAVDRYVAMTRATRQLVVLR